MKTLSRPEARRILFARPMDARVRREARAMLHEIGGKDLPLVGTKRGGYTAVYYYDAHAILLRVNSWNLMSIAQKRLTVAHEWIHARGVEHHTDGMFHSSMDLLSLELYKRVWGDDAALRELFKRLRATAKSLRK